MTLFIVWSVEHNAQVRQDYEAAVGEVLQDEPITNGTQFVVGSSRATPEQLDTIANVTYGDTLQDAGFDS